MPGFFDMQYIVNNNGGLPMKEYVYTRGIFIFRRDLRLEDNTGLNRALRECKEVIPLFIFDKRQYTTANEYRSTNALQFMIESLQELNEELKNIGRKLYCIEADEADTVVSTLIEAHTVQAVYVNFDYTPFSSKRDYAIAAACHKTGAEFFQSHDALLSIPGKVLKSDDTPYTVYTPFYKAASQHPVAKPEPLVGTHFFNGTLQYPLSVDIAQELTPKGIILQHKNDQIAEHGGRSKALAKLTALSAFTEYATTRDYPTKPTTQLSAHHKFGTCSIRESYYTAKKVFTADMRFIQELYWRDFFTHIAYHFPYVFKGSFYTQFDELVWSRSTEDFERWCTGTTGFPLIDAAMRQLNTTGYMHNRARMAVASFLTKDLHISWQWGEKYFATQLIDYDPCVNNGSWQWAASTGCDAQPYFRIFNPWLQQKKFDPECIYIKEWVPELRKYSADIIHNHEKTKQRLGEYPAPMVDHHTEKEKTLERFKAIKK